MCTLFWRNSDYKTGSTVQDPIQFSDQKLREITRERGLQWSILESASALKLQRIVQRDVNNDRFCIALLSALEQTG